jgi:hypothetical protein
MPQNDTRVDRAEVLAFTPGEWVVFYDGRPTNGVWNQIGPAQAQRDLLNSGYRKPQFTDRQASTD